MPYAVDAMEEKNLCLCQELNPDSPVTQPAA
jgi:hypothetical protein